MSDHEEVREAMRVLMDAVEHSPRFARAFLVVDAELVRLYKEEELRKLSDRYNGWPSEEGER